MKTKETRVKELGKELIKAFINFGKAFWSVLKRVGLFLNECYSWLAVIRTKAPRTSLTIELILFISASFFFMMSCYVDKVHYRDLTSKKLYDMEVKYNDSIIKAEVDGYNRGILETKNNEKEQAYEEQRS